MKIMNCPFCDGEAEICQKLTRNGDYVITYIKCQVCGARGRKIMSFEHTNENEVHTAAVKAWNTRIN